MLQLGLGVVTLPGAIMSFGCQTKQEQESSKAESSSDQRSSENGETTESTSTETLMQIQYLEIVTPDADAVCQTYAKMFGVTFGDADPSLGGARTAELAGGGVVAVRKPLRDTETPVVRPYVLVDDIKAAVDAAAESGAEIAMPPTEIPGHGTFAIFIQGGIESGLWKI